MTTEQVEQVTADTPVTMEVEDLMARFARENAAAIMRAVTAEERVEAYEKHRLKLADALTRTQTVVDAQNELVEQQRQLIEELQAQLKKAQPASARTSRNRAKGAPKSEPEIAEE